MTRVIKGLVPVRDRIRGPLNLKVLERHRRAHRAMEEDVDDLVPDSG